MQSSEQKLTISEYDPEKLFALCKQENERTIKDRVTAFLAGDDAELDYIITPEFFYNKSRIAVDREYLADFIKTLSPPEKLRSHREEVLLGFGYAQGIGVPKDSEEAKKHYLKAHVANEKIATLMLALLYYNLGEPEKAFHYNQHYNQSSKNKNNAAMLYLWAAQTNEENPAWTKHAAETGHPQAMVDEGIKLIASKNKGRAFEYFAEAAKKGIGPALVFFCYYHPQKKFRSLIQKYLPLVQTDHANTLEHLGRIYHAAAIEQSNYDLLQQSAEFYRRSSELTGNGTTLAELAKLYQSPLVKKDAKKVTVIKFHHAIASDNQASFSELAMQQPDLFFTLFSKEKDTLELLPLFNLSSIKKVFEKFKINTSLTDPLMKIIFEYWLNDTALEFKRENTVTMRERVQQFLEGDESAFSYITVDNDFCPDRLKEKRKAELTNEIAALALEKKTTPTHSVLLGYGYLHGIHFEKDMDKAKEYFAASNLPTGKFLFAVAARMEFYLTEQSFMHQAAEEGNMFAQYALFSHRHHQQQWKKAPKKIKYMFTLYDQAAFSVVPKTTKDFYTEAAKLGHHASLLRLAVDFCLPNKDESRAIEYLSLVAEVLPEAYLHLGNYYFSRNLVLASYCYRQYGDKENRSLATLLKNSRKLKAKAQGLFSHDFSAEIFTIQYHCAIGLAQKELLESLYKSNEKLFRQLMADETINDRERILSLSEKIKSGFCGSMESKTEITRSSHGSTPQRSH